MHKARVTLGIGLVASLLANCVLQVAATQVLSLFGASYAQQATWTLRILLLAAFPLTIKYHYIAICRIQDRIRRAMLGILPGSLLELSAAALGAHLGGLIGLSVGWVVAIYIESLFMVRTVVRTVRSPEMNTDASISVPIWLAHSTPTPVAVTNYLGGDAIWQIDTISLPIIRLTAIKKANKEIEKRRNEHGFQSIWRASQSERDEYSNPARSTVSSRQDADGLSGKR
jgi:hypothetical protein